MMSYVGASTTYTLLGKNVITVTESPMTCKNGKSTSVTTEITGDLYVLSKNRTNFSGNKWQTRMNELDCDKGDERGHVLASVFGGPAEMWNLVPQYSSVNRKLHKENSVLNRWYEFEYFTRTQLKTNNSVKFTIKIEYASQNGCRPIGFEINAEAKGTSGFYANFENGPFETFAVSSSGKPSKKT